MLLSHDTTSKREQEACGVLANLIPLSMSCIMHERSLVYGHYGYVT